MQLNNNTTIRFYMKRIVCLEDCVCVMWVLDCGDHECEFSVSLVSVIVQFKLKTIKLKQSK